MQAEHDVGEIEQGLAAALIADPLPLPAADMVELREAGAQQRDTEALGGMGAMAVGDQHLGAVGAGELLEVFQIADLDLCGGDLGQARRVGRRHRSDRLGTHAREQLREGDQQIGIGGEREAALADREMGVEHRVLQLRALALDALGHRLGADLGEGADEPIHRLQAHQMREAMVWNPGALGQQIGGTAHRAADHQRCGSVAQGRQLIERGAADGQGVVVVVDEMAVERIGDVGQHHRAQPEAFEQILQMLDIAGGQCRAGEHIDLTRAPTGTGAGGGGLGHQGVMMALTALLKPVSRQPL